MPAKIDRIAEQTISVISANKQFVTGGHYDMSQRDFIIDRHDVPALPELTADDWIVYNRRKYQVKTVEAFEVDAGWVVTGPRTGRRNTRANLRPAGGIPP